MTTFYESFEQEQNNKENQMLKTLMDAKKSLDNINVNFFIACGTALGAIRESKFISYDGDIDLGVFKWEIKEDDISKIIKSFENNNFKLIKQYGEFNHGYEMTFQHQETQIRVDIFLIYEEMRNNQKIWWLASYGGVCDSYKFKKCRFWNTPFKLNKIKFYGMIFNVPPEKYLEESYGQDWRTPKKFSYYEGLDSGYKNIIYD